MTTETPDQQTDVADPAKKGIEELASDVRQYVTFVAGNEVFAVGMAPVREIIRLPEVVRVPLAPATLDGLANLRGKVLPIISLRRMLGFAEQEHDDATRAIVIDVGQPLGFVVDRVTSVIGVESGQIESVGKIRSTVDTDLLSGIIKNAGGHDMIMVLDFEKLIQREFAQIVAITKSAGMTGALSADMEDKAGNKEEDEKAGDELQLVSFSVDEQEYAIDIADVQEIVQVPDTIIHVPHSESHVIGVMTLRSRLLPVVSLRRMLGLPDKSMDEKNRIVVLALDSASVGVAVDGVNEVLRVAKAYVDAMPTLLAKEGDLAEISKICRLDEDQHLVSIINTQNLFEHSAVKEALSTMSDIDQKTGEEPAELDEALEEYEQVVIFHLDKEEFGVPVNSVQEIVRVPEELTRVPKEPAFVEGVINLRGSVLPVIDLRLRLGLPREERSDRQRIIVFQVAGVHTGFIVDSVVEVLKIPRTVIEPEPKLSSEQGWLLSRLANMEKEKRIVQLLDPAHLVETTSQEA